jgi:hypothetical protein
MNRCSENVEEYVAAGRALGGATSADAIGAPPGIASRQMQTSIAKATPDRARVNTDLPTPPLDITLDNWACRSYPQGPASKRELKNVTAVSAQKTFQPAG